MKPSHLLALASLGLTLSLGTPGIATAQEDTTTQKQDQQAPAAEGQQQDGQPQFGPRAKKQAGQQQGKPALEPLVATTTSAKPPAAAPKSRRQR